MARATKRSAPAGQLSFGEAPPPRGPELLVLPDAARVEEHLLRAAEAGGLALAGGVCTVAELEQALIEAAHGERAAAGRAALELIYRRVCRERTPRGSPWFAVRETPGFARALRSLGAALGQGMMAADELQSLVAQLDERLQRRLGPLAHLLLAAQRELAQAGLCDGPGALRAALEGLAAEGPLPALLTGISALRFEAVLDWPPLRLEMLFALARRLARTRVPVRLALPFWPERPALAEEPLAPVLRAIERRGAQEGSAVPELLLAPQGEAGPLGGFRARLFAPVAAQQLDDGAPPDVSLVSCASPAAEAREAARRCADLLDAGAAPESIAIAVRGLTGGAAEELGGALDRLGIVWRERRGRPALAAPPVQLALSLYELLERSFPREPLAALLTSRQLWLLEPGERAPHEAVARRLRQARVRDALSDGGISAQLERLAQRLRQAAREEKNDAGRSRLERDAAEVDEVRFRAERAIAQLQTLPAHATLRAHGRALLALLDRWELRSRAQRSLPRDPGESAASPIRRAAAVGQERDLAGLTALEAGCADLAAAAREAGQGEQVFSRALWAELLSGALAEATLRPGGARGGAVQLLELRELPGRTFQHLIVTGLVDGVLPARGAIDPLLSDEEKRAINRGAARAVFRVASANAAPQGALMSASDPAPLPARQAEEALLFQLALGAAEASIALLWPRADARGRETPRSTFADEAARALGLAPSDGDAGPPSPGRIARAPLSAIPALSDCRSADELLARASLDAVADPAFRALAPAPAEEGRALVAALARSPLRDDLWLATRAALAERERLGAFVGSRAPGRFSGQLSGAALEAARPLFAYGPASPLSARQLEDDARCAFRTFGHRVLALREAQAVDDDLPALEKGNLLHRCLEGFYAAMRAEARLPLREPLESWSARLHAIAREEMSRFARAHDVGHRGLWQLRQRDLLRTLEAVIAAEAELCASPLELERAFGGESEGAWAPLRLPSPDGGDAVFVRGAIDRVDHQGVAGLTSSGPLLVLDYKSGRLQPLARKLRPESLLAPEFQLLLYAAAVRAQLPGREVDAVYLSLRDAGRSTTLRTALGKADLQIDAVLEMDPQRRAELRNRPGAPAKNLADAVWERVSRLRAGAFPVQPLDCDRCDLKPVCRIAALPVDEELLK